MVRNVITAEFFGGPNDGKTEEMEKFSDIVYIPILERLNISASKALREGLNVPPETKIRIGVYRAVARGRYGPTEIVRYEWEGLQK